MSTQEFAAFDRVFDRALDEATFTCAVAAVGDADGEAHRYVVGEADSGRGVDASEETVFDVASVTKAVVTTTVVLRLVEQGRLALTDSLSRHLPELDGRPRGEVQLHHLLSHTSGFQPYHFDEAWRGYRDAREGILAADIREHAPGERHEYSCLNFAHLAMIVEAVADDTLPNLAADLVFEPAGMETAKLGEPFSDDATVATTYDWDHGRGSLSGTIHDPLANAMAGRSGNAGLFATVEDLSRFSRTILEGADGAGRLLAPTTVDRMAADNTPDGVDPRGLGWRVGDGFLPAPTWSDRVVGHTGYTGTSLWLDLDRERYCVILTNEVATGKEDSEMPRVRELAHGVAGAVPDSAF